MFRLCLFLHINNNIYLTNFEYKKYFKLRVGLIVRFIEHLYHNPLVEVMTINHLFFGEHVNHFYALYI